MYGKRLVILAAMVCIILTFARTAAAQNFTDLPSTHWAYNDIVYLTEKNVIGGYRDGTVKPNRPVTREELAKIVFTLFPDAMESLKSTDGPDYPDIHNRWSTPYLNTASSLIPGYTDGQFQPSQPATRRDVATLLLYARLIQEGNYRLDNGYPDIALPVPAEEAWKKMQQFKEYTDLEKLYRESDRYLESDPDKKQFYQFAGQFFSHLNDIAFLVDGNVIRGYADSTLRLEHSVTRAETCALARRICNMEISPAEEYIIENPAIIGVPHTVPYDNDSAHAKMVELGQWYQENYPTPLERARAIYSFMIFNFNYNWDYRAGLSGSAPTTLASTLTTGTGTDVNFANMYAVLAGYAGLKAAVVKGQSENPTESGPHTWVELTIDNRAVQVDPTYGICTGKYYFDNLREWMDKGYNWTEESRRDV